MEMAMFDPPNTHIELHLVLRHIVSSPPPRMPATSSSSALFDGFIESCLTKDADKRLSASQLLESDELMQEVDTTATESARKRLAQLVRQARPTLDREGRKRRRASKRL